MPDNTTPTHDNRHNADGRPGVPGVTAMAGNTDAGDADVDPEELQRQLTDIKAGMGLAERYPGQRRLWLVYGIGVGVAILLLQLLFALPVGVLPGWVYAAFVMAFALVATFGLFRLAAGTVPDQAAGTEHDWRAFFGTMVLAVVALAVLVEPSVSLAVSDLDELAANRLSGATAYGLIVAVAGVGFLFAGNALRAHRIRRRDRWVFYGAGLWMLTYAALFTQIAPLRSVGYGLFGLLLIGYSAGAYHLLGRDLDGGGAE